MKKNDKLVVAMAILICMAFAMKRLMDFYHEEIKTTQIEKLLE